MKFSIKKLSSIFLSILFTSIFIIFIYIKNIYADGWDEDDTIILPPVSGEPTGPTTPEDLPETSLGNSYVMIAFSLMIISLGILAYKTENLRKQLILYLDPIIQKILSTISKSHRTRLFENRLKNNDIEE